MSQEIFLPYGLNDQEQVIHISEVERGLTYLNCPFCHSPLVAKKGERLTHHFAHTENTCKDALSNKLEKITPQIPFYSSFFSSDLTESEIRAVKILHDKFGLSLFHKKGKKDSAFQVLYLNDILKIYQVWENLIAAKQIQQRGNWYHLSKQAELGLALLPLSEFASLQEQRLHFYESFLQAGTSQLDILRKKVFDNLKARVLYADLYCLHIPDPAKEKDVWKIGITTRTAKQRLQELLPAIKEHFGEERAKATYIAQELTGLGRLEAYIKKRFSHANLPFSYKGHVHTEFFATPELLAEVKSLSKLKKQDKLNRS